ncbi:MAG: biotin/acetyl-CoA-carboxylase ligase [Segetibacter sp.]|nr:biotin/acetyl-CoA-carboxylase ligase [Segetibacter sp.]
MYLIVFFLSHSALTSCYLRKNSNSLPPDNPIGTPLIILSEVDSTNNYAMAQVQALLADHGFAYFASYQKAGKGQRGKQWNAAPGENIILSLVLEPTTLPLKHQFFLSVTIAMACFDFFKSYGGEETSLKWPNDLYWRDRKAGGILIENVLQGNNWNYAITGIGININQIQFPMGINKAVSLKQITGKTFNVIELAKQLCGYLEARWRELLKGDFERMLQEYNSHLFKRGERVLLKKDNAVFDAIINGVNVQGELLVDTGIISTIPFGTVEWILE